MMGLCFDQDKICKPQSNAVFNGDKICGNCLKILKMTENNEYDVCPHLHKKMQQKIDEIVKIRQRCDDLHKIREAVDSAYDDVIKGCNEFDGNADANEDSKMLAETIAFTVLYKQITENQNNARN